MLENKCISYSVFTVTNFVQNTNLSKNQYASAVWDPGRAANLKENFPD